MVETAVENSKDENISDRKDSEPSNVTEKNELQKLFSEILEHPDLKKWFLAEADLPPQSKCKASTKTLSRLVTMGMTKVIASFPVEMQKISQQQISGYVNKINQACQRYMSHSRIKSEFEIHVLSAIIGVQFAFPWNILTDITEKLLQFPNEGFFIEEGDESKLTKHVICVLSCLTTLCDTIKRDYPYHQFVPYKLTQGLIQIATSYSLTEFDQVIVSLLQKSSCCTDLLNEEQFKILLEAEIPSKLEILGVCVQSSFQCKKWFISWVNSGLPIKKKHLPAVTGYLLSGIQIFIYYFKN